MDTGQFDRFRVISPKAPRAALNCIIEIEDQAVALSFRITPRGRKKDAAHQPMRDRNDSKS
jgi:hypothetical protein